MNQAPDKEKGLITFSFADENHLKALARLVEEYKNDPMGDAPEKESSTFSERQKFKLIVGLDKNPSCRIFLWNEDFTPVGIAICFEKFSTFMVQPIINIHDFYLDKNFRGQGIGESFLKDLVADLTNFGYGKITLEVREDNLIAQNLYKKRGFSALEPKMLFWSKEI